MIEDKTNTSQTEELEEKVEAQCQLVQTLKNQINAFLSVLLMKQKDEDK
jgi:hypothetical protein